MNEQQENTQQQPKINTGLVALDIVAKMNKVNIDMRSIVKKYGINTADISPEDLMRVAKDSLP